MAARVRTLRVGVCARVALALSLFATSLGASTWYASPNGSGSKCTIAAPCLLQFLLNGGSGGDQVRTGDTIYVRAGTYTGNFQCTLQGSAAARITVQNYPDGSPLGERAQLDNGDLGNQSILIKSSYVDYVGLELTSSGSNTNCGSARHSCLTGSSPADIKRGDGVAVDQKAGASYVGNRIRNCIIHDTRQGISHWIQASNTEIVGNDIYYNGWAASDRNHGHGLYIQNRDPSVLNIQGNISEYNFDNGSQAYAQGAYVDNVTYQQNVFFRNGTIAGQPPSAQLYMNSGRNPMKDPSVRDNVFYIISGSEGGITFLMSTTGNHCSGNVTFQNNFIGGATRILDSTCYPSSGTCSGLVMYDDLLEGEALKNCTGTATFPLHTNYGKDFQRVFADPYSSGRGTIFLYNNSQADRVAIDLSSILPNGAAYVILSSLSPWGSPVASGTYSGGTVSIPMTNVPVDNIVGLNRTPSAAFPRAATFLVVKTRGGAATTPTSR